MRTVTLLLVVAALSIATADAAGDAHGATLGVQGSTLVLDGAGKALDATVDWVPGPCHYAVKDGEDGVGHEVDDAAGCFLMNVDAGDAVPLGAGCWRSDALNPMFDDPARKVMLYMCGASGVQRFELRGGDRADEVELAPSYGFGGATAVLLGAGNDRVTAVDAAVEQIDCGAGYDESREDPADVSQGCEESNAVVDAPTGAANGRIERRGGTLVADFTQARGNQLRRLVVDVGARADERAVVFGVASQALPANGEGCAMRRVAGSESALDAVCGWDGVAALEILGPTALKDRFDLDVDLDGFPGAATIHAGPGPAIIHAADGVAQHVDCGPGYDGVEADARDHVEGDCESSTGEGTLEIGDRGTVARKGGTLSGRLPFWYGNSGQGVLTRVSCPTTATDGCGGMMEVTLTRKPRLQWGAGGYAVPAGRTATVGVAGAIGAGSFRAARGVQTRDRFFAELRRYGNLKARVVVAHGVGAHRTERAFTVTFKRSKGV